MKHSPAVPALSLAVGVLLTLPGVVHAVSGTSQGDRGTLLVSEETYHGNTVVSHVLALRGTTVRVLTGDRPFSRGSLTPSPDDKRVAFVAYPITCCKPGNDGVWTIDRDGTHERQIVGTPRSPCRNPASTGSVAWATGGERLAFTVFVASDALNGCQAGVRDVMGTWVTPYTHPRPRQITFDTSPGASDPVSWSTNAQVLAVNTPGGVRVVRVSTGSTRFTIYGARQGVFAPMTGTLAYITGGFQPRQPLVLWAAGAEGHHRHVLASFPDNGGEFEIHDLHWSQDGRSITYFTDTGIHRPGKWTAGIRTIWVAGAASHRPRALVVDRTGSISSPVWSPDNRSIAYLGHCRCGIGEASQDTSAVWSLDVAGGAPHLLIHVQTPKARGWSRQFGAIAWMAR